MSTDALACLNNCRTSLLAATGYADQAVPDLTGARHSRASELLEMLREAQEHADRLAFVVEGDIRAYATTRFEK